jgi:asparagine synthetase B (glutamine-hydrolysing)
MCGIAGIVYGANARRRVPAGEAAAAMAATLVHRGPDDGGVWASDDGSVALAHRRLSIIDLSPLGRNPMAYDDGGCGSRSTARSTTSSSCATSSKPPGTGSARRPTPK